MTAPSPRMPEEEALESSLHTYLHALSQRPMTPRNLVELERATKLARQILGISRAQMSLTGNFDGNGYIMGETLQEGTNVGYDASIQAIQSSTAETFGASIMRELIASIKEVIRPPAPAPDAAPFFSTQMSGADLVYAISMAREKGLSDLEKKLEAKLLAMADKATDRVIDSLVEEPGSSSTVCTCESEPHCRIHDEPEQERLTPS